MNRKPPANIRWLITKGLGYCCPWAFFFTYRKTQLIADRLGCDPRTVRTWRRKLHFGLIKCERPCKGCMYGFVKELRE